MSTTQSNDAAKAVQQFQQVSAILLKKHYGLDLNDTELWDTNIVQQCIEQRLRPYQVIVEHAHEADLHRIDQAGFYGVPSQAPITADDEMLAYLQTCED